MQHAGILMFYLKLAKKGNWAGDIKLQAENVDEIRNTLSTYTNNVINEKYFHKPFRMEKASMATNWIYQRINYVNKEFTSSCLRNEK